MLKFLASLCLLGFLVGLMLGDVLKKPQQPATNQLLHLEEIQDGIRLCFNRLPEVRSGSEQGFYWLGFVSVQGKAATGGLNLPGQGRIKWQLEQRPEGLLLGFAALQPLQGSWQAGTSSCIDVWPVLADAGRSIRSPSDGADH